MQGRADRRERHAIEHITCVLQAGNRVMLASARARSAVAVRIGVAARRSDVRMLTSMRACVGEPPLARRRAGAPLIAPPASWCAARRAFGGTRVAAMVPDDGKDDEKDGKKDAGKDDGDAVTKSDDVVPKSGDDAAPAGADDEAKAAVVVVEDGVGHEQDEHNGDADEGDKSGSGGDIDSSSSEMGAGDVTTALTTSKHRVPPRPPVLLVLPLNRRPIFPGYFSGRIVVTDAALARALKETFESAVPYVGVFLTAPGAAAAAAATATGGGGGGGSGSSAAALAPDFLEDSKTLVDVKQVHPWGTMCQVMEVAQREDGSVVALLLGRRRVIVRGGVGASKPLIAKVEHADYPEVRKESDHVKAAQNEIVTNIRELHRLSALFKEQVRFIGPEINVGDGWHLTDFVGAVCSADADDLQAMLAEANLEKRMNLALEILKKELQLCHLQLDISKEVEKRVSKNQRTYMLQEQLRAIKKELGLEKDDKEALAVKFKDRVGARRRRRRGVCVCCAVFVARRGWS